MTAALVQRVVALAAVALIAALVGLVVTGNRGAKSASTAPQVVPVAGGGWYHAMAAVRRGPLGRRTSCGHILTAGLPGVGDPILPCGAKIFIGFGKTQVLTQVIDRSENAPGHRFDLTRATAATLGIRGVQPVRWAFAR